MIKIILKILIVSMYTPIIIDSVKQLNQDIDKYLSNLKLKTNIKTYVKDTLSKCKCTVCEQNRRNGIKPIH